MQYAPLSDPMDYSSLDSNKKQSNVSGFIIGMVVLLLIVGLIIALVVVTVEKHKGSSSLVNFFTEINILSPASRKRKVLLRRSSQSREVSSVFLLEEQGISIFHT